MPHWWRKYGALQLESSLAFVALHISHDLQLCHRLAERCSELWKLLCCSVKVHCTLQRLHAGTTASTRVKACWQLPKRQREKQCSLQCHTLYTRFHVTHTHQKLLDSLGTIVLHWVGLSPAHVLVEVKRAQSNIAIREV